MRIFEVLTAIAAPLPLANVDTDKILAGRYLKTISREGLGCKLFATMRYDDDGLERPSFILNRAPWRDAGILVALDNFGCGSSREHAPWALADFGIRCIVAPSFADIFYGNCFKNGILPVTLVRADVEVLMLDAENPETALLHIDLRAQRITRSDGSILRFDITPERKQALLSGDDQIDASLRLGAEIDRWERTAVRIAPPIPNDIATLT